MSTLNVANISDGADSIPTGYVVNGSAKAWVEWDGTGIIYLRDSMNVSSVTDNGVGQFTANFTNNMDTASYSFSLSCKRAVTSNESVFINVDNNPTASTFNLIISRAAATNAADSQYVSATFHGDLA